MDKKTKAIIVDMVLGAAVAAGVIRLNWAVDGTLWQKLSDGFFVAAVLLLGMGGIRWVNNTGSFDAMGYSIKTTVQTFLPMLQVGRLADHEEDFLSYKERKAESRKDASDLLMVGAFYLVLSVAALVLYYIA